MAAEGQGAFTAARLLGAAASSAEGAFALAFPSFGPSDGGAPMRAFTKMDRAPIGDRSAVRKADYVVYLDETLLGPLWTEELKPTGLVLVNSAKDFEDARVLSIDANGISADILGRPIPNTVFLGAIAALDDCVTLETAIGRFAGTCPQSCMRRNERIVNVAYRAVSELAATRFHAPGADSMAPDDSCIARCFT